MPRLPRDLDGYDVRRAFERDGWVHARTRGSHMLLEKPGFSRPLVIPVYRLGPDIIQGLLRTAGMSRERFLDLLGE